MYRQIRDYFYQKQVLEVETPIFSPAGNPDPSIQSLIADFNAVGSSQTLLRYAHTSPEFAMKCLLAEGSGSIYQLCKVFRLGETGRLHNPEFSMLEWYRVGLTYFQLMDEIEELLQVLGVAEHCQRLTYAELFNRYLSLDVMGASSEVLKSCALKHSIDVVGMADDDNSYNSWCDLLLSHIIEPKLKTLGAVFVYDYPATQAALARIRIDSSLSASSCPENHLLNKSALAERFELYIDGVEIANGYQELTDVSEYRRRFERENNQRLTLGLDQIVLDDKLLYTLEKGLPDCSGVAIGLDRMLMCYLGLSHIQDVLSFDFD